jgi:ABC-2 type transport system ATP-binding protein
VSHRDAALWFAELQICLCRVSLMRMKQDRHSPSAFVAGHAVDAVAVLDNVTAGYGGKTVIRGVSLALQPSEVFVLMGPNGSGKTSLVRILTGLLKPLTGTVAVSRDGLSAPIAQSVRLVPQEIALYPWLTGRENCIAFARIAGASWKNAPTLADRALALARCEEAGSVQVGRLSGGFKRRVNIAAALIGEPRLLILDEPTAGIDLDAKRTIFQTIASLKSLGLSILIVTHDFDDADALADRVGFLFDGRLVRTGLPRELIASAFGSRKRIEIGLAVGPDDNQRNRLRSVGASPTMIDTVWVMFSNIEDWDTKKVLSPLQSFGLAIREFKVRDPGLEALYANLRNSAS